MNPLHIQGYCYKESQIGEVVNMLITKARGITEVVEAYGDRNISYNVMVEWDENGSEYHIIVHIGHRFSYSWYKTYKELKQLKEKA